MTTEQAIAYAKRKAFGDTSAEENAALAEWIKNASRREYLQFSDACIIFLEEQNDDAELYQPSSEEVIKRLNAVTEKAKRQREANSKPLYIRMLHSVNTRWQAAAVLIVLLAGTMYWYVRRPAEPAKLATGPAARSYIKPSLTLADGTVISIDSPLISVPQPLDYSELIVLDSANQNHPRATGSIVQESIEFRYHTISVPAGRQYKIKLPDGTLVWLNARSALKYPALYGEGARRVTLQGEAYFEVAPDAGKPFIVTARTAEVQVLGTRFNVNAYEDEGDIRITLLNGSVKVSEGNRSQVLKEEGQQALLYNNRLMIQRPDTAHILKWKEGYFDFQRSSVQAMMRQIARWYNVQVEYEDGIAPGTYTGTISRNIHLEDLVTLLKNSGIRLKVREDTISIQSVLRY